MSHEPRDANATQELAGRYWGRFAPSYNRDGEYVVGQAILDLIVGRLSAEGPWGETVEFGCGTGFFTRAIAPKATHVFATDLSDEMLVVARKELCAYSKVTIRKADCADSGFADAQFDSVLMANLLHVLAEPDRCLQESHRVLRVGGSLVAVDLTAYGMRPCDAVRLGLRYMRRWGLPPRRGQDAMTPDALAGLARSAGFQVEAVDLLEAGSNALYMRGRKCAKPRSM
jgi:ABC-2 type transport system ATP-binding protein